MKQHSFRGIIPVSQDSQVGVNITPIRNNVTVYVECLSCLILLFWYLHYSWVMKLKPSTVMCTVQSWSQLYVTPVCFSMNSFISLCRYSSRV